MNFEEEERRRRFFYAEADARVYDASITWVVPRYELLHATINAAVARAVSAHAASDLPFGILDVGAGTGTDTLAALRTYPTAHVVAVDLCEPMLRRIESELAGAGNALDARCTLLHADILSEAAKPATLLDALPQALRSARFSVVVSSLTVHHFSNEEKRDWYRRMFEVLAPGGFLILADLFSHSDPAFTEQWLEYDLTWMRSHFLPPNGSDEETAISPAERNRLLQTWIEHYEKDNRLEPIESTLGQPGQAETMTEIGFTNVSTLYRFSLSGILVGQRPA